MPSSGDDVAIFWDYENCEVPTDISVYYAIWEIYRVAERYGTVRLFNAYLEASRAKAAFRSDLESSEVRLIDCPHLGKKDVADKMILIDMFAYALDHLGPSTTLVLITGDGDFTRAVITLTRREYRVVIISPSQVSRVLARTASVLLDWTRDVLKSQPRPRSAPTLASHYYTSEDEDWEERARESPSNRDECSDYSSDYGESVDGLPTPDTTTDESDEECHDPSWVARAPQIARRRFQTSRSSARHIIKRASDLPQNAATTPNYRSKRDTFCRDGRHLPECTEAQQPKPILESRISDSTSQSSDTGRGPDTPDGDFRDTRNLEDMNFSKHIDRDPTPKRPSARRSRRGHTSTQSHSETIASLSASGQGSASGPSLFERIGSPPPLPPRPGLRERISSFVPSLTHSTGNSTRSSSSLPSLPSPTSPTHLYSPKKREYYSHIFSPLIVTLQQELSRGHVRPLRNALAPQMLAVYGLDSVGHIYDQANCAKGGFKEYLDRARNVGIVEVGGAGEGRWVALTPEWE